MVVVACSTRVAMKKYQVVSGEFIASTKQQLSSSQQELVTRVVSGEFIASAQQQVESSQQELVTRKYGPTSRMSEVVNSMS